MSSSLGSGSWLDHETYWLNISPQGSPEWHKHRKRLTASRVGYALGMNLKFYTPEKIALEILEITKSEIPERNLLLMEKGVIQEPIARKWYTDTYKVKVELVGLAIPKWDIRIGASSDGLVGSDGMLEIKCVEKMYAPILNYLRMQETGYSFPAGYHDHIWITHYIQIQVNLIILGRKWCDYIVMCTNENRIFIQRIHVDAQYWNEVIYPGIQKFLNTILEPLMKQHGIEYTQPL